jgi:hypothetical protein
MKLLLIASVLILVTKLESKFYHRFRKIECGSSLKTIENQYCYLKAYKRNNPVMNYGFTLKRIVPDGKVKMIR